MTDPYYDNVVLLLPFDQDVPGGCPVIDYSPLHNGLTATGNPVLSAAQVKYGDRSCLFTAANADRLEGNNASFNLGDSDFTVEGWFYVNSLATTRGLFYQGAAYGGETSKIEAQIAYNGSITLRDFTTFAFSTSAGSVTTGAWYHLAFVRSGTSLFIFVNGILSSTATKSAGAVTTGNLFEIGYCMEYGTNQNKTFDGYIDDLRITKGIARYTADFTPPTALKADCPYTPPTFSLRAVGQIGINRTFEWCTLPPKKQVTGQIGINRTFEWCTLPPKKQAIGQPQRLLRPELRPYFGGNGAITGVVKAVVTPVKRRVRLYEANTGILIQEIWSNDDGTYSFPGMKKGISYTLMAVDYTDTFDDVVIARVMAV